ncbi:endonuclease/exonuclease/phosphatase family protein [Dactylosporangium sp. CS-047395]|uniref:endonuclease/exonuclease/phosphatase family protein n=1 Tax=Dactylosporangium sp. CS-047395 TaxID=3239936 RepID=UPI003D950189
MLVLVANAVFAAAGPVVPAHAVETTSSVMRPVVDTFNNWLVKPGGTVWAATDDPVLSPAGVPASDWIWAGGAARVAEVGLAYPDFHGMQPSSGLVRFYANTGPGTRLRVDAVACGAVQGGMTMAAGQGFAWRSFRTNAARLYCGPTGQDQRLRLRFTSIDGPDTNVRAAYVDVTLTTSPARVSAVAFNIGETTSEAGLNAVAATIRLRSPDVVMLNEVRERGIFPDEATSYVARRAGYPYWSYHATATLGLTGTKGVAVLSRYAFIDEKFHPVRFTCDLLGVPVQCSEFGALQVSMNIGDVRHEVFSLRFSPMHRLPDGSRNPDYDRYEWTSNRAGHDLARSLARAVPCRSVVIMGGDFNANWRYAAAGPWPTDTQTPWSVQFRDTAGLRDAQVEYQRPVGGAWDDRVDYIYYRGPYVTRSAGSAPAVAGASDHGYVWASFGYSQAMDEDLMTTGGCSMES